MKLFLLLILRVLFVTYAEEVDSIVEKSELASRVWHLTKFDEGSYPDARCLDGSYAGYWYILVVNIEFRTIDIFYRNFIQSLRFIEGSGEGKNKFLIHLQGGGWCTSLGDCYERSVEGMGTSKHWIDEVVCPEDGDH